MSVMGTAELVLAFHTPATSNTSDHIKNVTRSIHLIGIGLKVQPVHDFHQNLQLRYASGPAGIYQNDER